MVDITAQQRGRWALFGRNPNDWAVGGSANFPEGHLYGHNARFTVGTTGRQVGKTEELADLIDQHMNAKPRARDKRPDLPPACCILAPSYPKAELAVSRYIENLARTFGVQSFRKNDNDHELVILDSMAGIPGARLKWLSAQEMLNVIGDTWSWAGVDEAQEVPDEIWNKFLPTLDVRDADVNVFGTPDTQVNQTWFQGLWDAGQDPLDESVYSFTIASWEAPWMNIERILWAKDHIPENEFRRLYGGEWVADAGLVFTGYEPAMLAATPKWDPRRRAVMAVDLAISTEFNVAMVGDPLTRTAFYYERWNLTDPLETYDRILDIHGRFGRPKVWIDATGMGKIPARELAGHLGQSMVIPVEWSAGAAARYNKMNAVRQLAGDLQHRKTMFPGSWDDLKRELGSFVYTRTPSGLLSASARSGAHDDIVMTLAMLNLAFSRRSEVDNDNFQSNYLTNGVPSWAEGLELMRA